ncbi:MAG: clostri-philic family protein [Clostridium sp.]
MGKAFINNPMQKGERRQKLKKSQDDVGNNKNVPEYKDFDGNPIR